MTTPENNQQQPGQQPGQQPPRQPSILDHKTAACANLRAIFMRPLMMERLLKMAGGDESRVAKYMTGFFAVIMQDDGGKEGSEKFYFQCNINSLVTCFLESVNMQLPFDSRNLIAMIIYKKGDGLEAELDISYKGFVNALNRHFKNAFVECKLVFEKDKFISKIVGRTAHYEYEPENPFAVVTEDYKGIKGGYCFFSYTDSDGAETSRLVFLSTAQILKNKSRARSNFVWKSDPKAMAEKTCIREGARLPFAAIDLEVDIEAVDNKHYQLDKPDAHLRLKNLIEAQDAEHGKEKTPEPVQPPVGNTDNPPSGQDDGQKPADDGKGGTGQAPAENATAANAPGDPALVPQEQQKVAPVSSEKQAPANQGEQQVLEPAKSETTPAITITGVVDTAYEEIPLTQSQGSPASSETPAPATPAAWDGKTVYMGSGKSITKDTFASSQQAAVYLKKIVATRSKKEVRAEIVAGNALLMAALQKDGNTAILVELQKLSIEGE